MLPRPRFPRPSACCRTAFGRTQAMVARGAREQHADPNWDLASTCTVEGKPGIALIEAKAHDQELIKEETGRKGIDAPVTGNARRNFLRIEWAIRDASAASRGYGAAVGPVPELELSNVKPLRLGLEAVGSGHSGGPGLSRIPESQRDERQGSADC